MNESKFSLTFFLKFSGIFGIISLKTMNEKAKAIAILTMSMFNIFIS